MSKGQVVPLPRTAAAVVRRFTELGDADQLRTYKAVREYLLSRNLKFQADKALDDRLSTIEAISRVAAHLGLDSPKELQVKHFDDASEELRGGWSSGQVIRTWKRWAVARDVAAGDRASPTARQRALRGALGVDALRSDDYIESVRLWLESKPPKLNIRSYREWASEHNVSRSEGELRVAGYMTIQNELGIGWEAIISVARGEITLEEAQKNHVAERNTTVRPEHALVTTGDIVAMWGRNKTQVAYYSREDNFPKPVVILGDNRRFWLRTDIEAFVAGQPFPDRKPNELGQLYVTQGEAKKIVGTTSAIAYLAGCPEPKYSGAHYLWLRSEIEAWAAERRSRNIGPGRWKRRPRER